MDCVDIIRRGVGRNLSEDEVLELFEQAKKLKAQALAGVNAADMAAEVQARAQKLAAQRELAAIAKKRAALLQMKRRLALADKCLSGQWNGMEAEGLVAALTGSKYSREGARMSVDGLANALKGKYLGGLLTDMEGLDPTGRHLDLLVRGAMDREISAAMWHVEKPAAWKGPKEALEIAKTIHKWNEIARKAENEAGAWIGKEPGYIVRQSHDPLKMERIPKDLAKNYGKSGKADPQRVWIDYVRERLDWSRTADGRFDPGLNQKEMDEWLAQVYANIVSGFHEVHGADSPASLAKREGNMGRTAAKASRERVLHFKSGEAWFDYHQRYGQGNLGDAIIRGLSRAAESAALMRLFGPSPQATLENVSKDLKRILQGRGDFAGVRRVSNMRRTLENRMKEVDGSLNMGGNPRAAEICRNVRAMESMSKLGGALISSITDVPNMGFEFAWQGMGLFRPMAEEMALMLKGKGSLAQRRLLSLCGVYSDAMIGQVASRFTGEGLNGKASALMNLFFKLNGLTFWTDWHKKAVTLMISRRLAMDRELSFDRLPAGRRRMLELYDIDEGCWDMLRRRNMIMDDGLEHMVPDSAFDIPDGELAAYMGKKGMRFSAARAEEFREELCGRLRTLIRDRLKYAVLEPDADSQAALRQGSSSGTILGEALRFVTQFKSFPMVFIRRSLFREIYGNSDSFLGGLWGGARGLNPFAERRAGGANNLACLFLMMTALGFVAMNVKALLANKTPRLPKADDAESWRDVFVASALQGGGLGIFGDFLFGEKTRMGTSPLSAALGPTAGSAESFLNLWQNAREGKDAGSQAFRAFYSLVPGNNLFYYRPAFEYLIGMNMYEMMNPGYIRRMKRRIKKENRQELLFEPMRW